MHKATGNHDGYKSQTPAHARSHARARAVMRMRSTHTRRRTYIQTAGVRCVHLYQLQACISPSIHKFTNLREKKEGKEKEVRSRSSFIQLIGGFSRISVKYTSSILEMRNERIKKETHILERLCPLPVRIAIQRTRSRSSVDGEISVSRTRAR